MKWEVLRGLTDEELQRIDSIYQRGSKCFTKDKFYLYLMEIGSNVYEKQILPHEENSALPRGGKILHFPINNQKEQA